MGSGVYQSPRRRATTHIRRSLAERSVFRSIIVKIPKKSNLKICENWRGICVLPVITKIIFKFILDRIKDHFYSTIDRQQAGFRAASSCIHINTLRIIIEQSAEYRSDLHLIFVDFEKAIDSVDREGLWMALGRMRIPNKLV